MSNPISIFKRAFFVLFSFCLSVPMAVAAAADSAGMSCDTDATKAQETCKEKRDVAKTTFSTATRRNLEATSEAEIANILKAAAATAKPVIKAARQECKKTVSVAKSNCEALRQKALELKAKAQKEEAAGIAKRNEQQQAQAVQTQAQKAQADALALVAKKTSELNVKTAELAQARQTIDTLEAMAPNDRAAINHQQSKASSLESAVQALVQAIQTHSSEADQAGRKAEQAGAKAEQAGTKAEQHEVQATQHEQDAHTYGEVAHVGRTVAERAETDDHVEGGAAEEAIEKADANATVIRDAVGGDAPTGGITKSGGDTEPIGVTGLGPKSAPTAAAKPPKDGGGDGGKGGGGGDESGGGGSGGGSQAKKNDGGSGGSGGGNPLSDLLSSLTGGGSNKSNDQQAPKLNDPAAADSSCSNPTKATSDPVCVCQANPRAKVCEKLTEAEAAAVKEGRAKTAAAEAAQKEKDKRFALQSDPSKPGGGLEKKQGMSGAVSNGAGGSKGGGIGSGYGPADPKSNTVYKGSYAGGAGVAGPGIPGVPVGSKIANGYFFDKNKKKWSQLPRSTYRPPSLADFLPGARRGPASVSVRDGITGPHTNQFQKVRARYSIIFGL